MSRELVRERIAAQRAWLRAELARSIQRRTAARAGSVGAAPARAASRGYRSRVDPESEPGGPAPSVLERLRGRFGDLAVPRVSTATGEEDPQAGATESGVLSRLGKRAVPATRFRVDGEIARGGMGAILAEDGRGEERSSTSAWPRRAWAGWRRRASASRTRWADSRRRSATITR